MPERNWSQEDAHRPDRAVFPVPDLVLFALRNVLGFPWSGHEEKVRWSVHCAFNGVPLSMELRKFGFTICHPKGATVDMARIYGQLQVAVKLTEDWLQPYAEAQVEAGAVTIENRHHEFDRRYRFFRQHADRAYRRAAVPRKKKTSEQKTEGAAIFHAMPPRGIT